MSLRSAKQWTDIVDKELAKRRGAGAPKPTGMTKPKFKHKVAPVYVPAPVVTSRNKSHAQIVRALEQIIDLSDQNKHNFVAWTGIRQQIRTLAVEALRKVEGLES